MDDSEIRPTFSSDWEESETKPIFRKKRKETSHCVSESRYSRFTELWEEIFDSINAYQLFAREELQKSGISFKSPDYSITEDTLKELFHSIHPSQSNEISETEVEVLLAHSICYPRSDVPFTTISKQLIKKYHKRLPKSQSYLFSAFSTSSSSSSSSNSSTLTLNYQEFSHFFHDYRQALAEFNEYELNQLRDWEKAQQLRMKYSILCSFPTLCLSWCCYYYYQTSDEIEKKSKAISYEFRRSEYVREKLLL